MTALCGVSRANVVQLRGCGLFIVVGSVRNPIILLSCRFEIRRSANAVVDSLLVFFSITLLFCVCLCVRLCAACVCRAAAGAAAVTQTSTSLNFHPSNSASVGDFMRLLPTTFSHTEKDMMSG